MESTQLHRLDVSGFDFLNDFRIVIQPQGKGLLVGQSHVLEVYAAGEELAYQWQKNGQDLPGETARTLRLAEVETADSGDYTVRLKSGTAPAVSSEVATVTVFERAEGRWDPIFDQSDRSVGGRVHLLPGGEAIVVRTDTTSQRIYRIGSDGGVDQTSSTTTSSGGRSLSFIDRDGRIVVGAKPQGNTTALRRDDAFNTAGHTVTNLRRVAQQADGKIFLVGGFTSFGGVPAAGYVRLNANGTVDENFYTATGFSSGTIHDVTYDPRGYLYLSVATSGGSSSATFQGQGRTTALIP